MSEGQMPDFSKKYKRNNNSQHNIITIFVTTFLIMLVFFTAVAKQLTPNVDVSIGEDSSAEPKESGLGVKRFIDNRLKSIQMEDTGLRSKKVVENERPKFEEDDESEYFSEELEEKVKIPTTKIVKEMEQKALKPTKVAPKPPAAIVIQPSDYPEPTVSNINLKVVVGRYSTADQAKAAQTILQNSGLGVTPFIKSIDGTYTLQVGSFTSSSKAEALTTELLNNNFPARIIKD